MGEETGTGLAYLAQPQTSECFVYAVANYLIHCGRVPDMAAGRRAGRCAQGPVTDHRAVLRAMGAALQVTDDWALVLARGGIVVIQHPLVNLHAVFAAPVAPGRVRVVNSWLGPVQMVLDAAALDPFRPAQAIHNRHWVVGESAGHPFGG